MRFLPQACVSLWGAGLFFCSVLLPSSAQEPAPPTAASAKWNIHWVPHPERPHDVAVQVSGMTPTELQFGQSTLGQPNSWDQILSIYAEQSDLLSEVGLPPMTGDYRVESNHLLFRPRFPLLPGIRYRAVFRPDRLPGKATNTTRGFITAHLQLPNPPPAIATHVIQIYPSAQVLPENLLKFYVHFSAPMSQGQIYDHIHLHDADGNAIDLPFLQIEEELWDPEMKRLTLFIDPGRIKRGVRPLEEIGPALEEGKHYVLTIDSAWKDGTGYPLRETATKRFFVGPPDREPPDPTQWTIHPPTPGTFQPLRIHFKKSLDHALTQRLIHIATTSDHPIDGTVQLTEQERLWTLTPTQPWQTGKHKIIIQTTLEDLAGNNVGKPFEVDLFEGVQKRITHSSVTIPFEVR